MSRIMSDHFPNLLECKDWGKGKGCNIHGSINLVLAKKLKLLKEDIKTDVFGRLEDKTSTEMS